MPPLVTSATSASAAASCFSVSTLPEASTTWPSGGSASLCPRRRRQQRQAQCHCHETTQNSFFMICPPLVFPRPDPGLHGQRYPVGFPTRKREHPASFPSGQLLDLLSHGPQRKVAIWPRVQVELGSKRPPPTPEVMPWATAQSRVAIVAARRHVLEGRCRSGPQGTRRPATAW